MTPFCLTALPAPPAVAALCLLLSAPALAQEPAQKLLDLVNRARALKPADPGQAAAPAAPAAPGQAAAAPTPLATAAATRPMLPRYQASADGAEITDRESGLVWRRCAEGMAWNGSTCDGQPAAFSSLMQVLRHARAQSAATQQPWRVPVMGELQSLVNQNFDGGAGERSTAGHDLLAFPATPSDAFCSSTLYYPQRGDRDRTKAVSFVNGLDHFRDNGEAARLRLVRNAPGNTRVVNSEPVPVEAALVQQAVDPARRFAVSASGQEVTDHKTRLVWRRCAEGMTAQAGGCRGTALALSHAAAMAHADKARSGGWRLPNRDELASIADESRHTMAIDTQAFPGTPAEHFWTSSRENDQYVKAVNFYNGSVYSRYQTNAHHLRLVRDAR